MDYEISGRCQHKIHRVAEDPCYHCGFCTIDGNDYSYDLRDKPGGEQRLDN